MPMSRVGCFSGCGVSGNTQEGTAGSHDMFGSDEEVVVDDEHMLH